MKIATPSKSPSPPNAAWSTGVFPFIASSPGRMTENDTGNWTACLENLPPVGSGMNPVHAAIDSFVVNTPARRAITKRSGPNDTLSNRDPNSLTPLSWKLDSSTQLTPLSAVMSPSLLNCLEHFAANAKENVEQEHAQLPRAPSRKNGVVTPCTTSDVFDNEVMPTGVRLWRMVTDMSVAQPEIMQWTDDGDAFLVTDHTKTKVQFAKIMKAYGFPVQFRSFHRLLNALGFTIKRLYTNPDEPWIQRCRTNYPLITKIARHKSPGKFLRNSTLAEVALLQVPANYLKRKTITPVFSPPFEKGTVKLRSNHRSEPLAAHASRIFGKNRFFPLSYNLTMEELLQMPMSPSTESQKCHYTPANDTHTAVLDVLYTPAGYSTNDIGAGYNSAAIAQEVDSRKDLYETPASSLCAFTPNPFAPETFSLEDYFASSSPITSLNQPVILDDDEFPVGQTAAV
ncbi:hypothetical protein MPSEU_000126800 [Mayamaea pseudoterrestris]|nr:hypothetical protein MPSEU_000125500 [Mayamaea pseudoterrestris]GKY91549.1 hypothetical protein MPSEU_000126800 [Mayamaea pseudoterrestris]